MKRKHIYIFILIVLCIYLTMIGKSFSQELPNESRESINLTLKGNGNIENSILEHINLIDNALIPLASFDQSIILSDNYEFLVNFAIKFILDNQDYYEDKIIEMDEYIYNDEYNIYKTNKYVNKNVIYEITKSVFNKSDYVILNKNLKINNDMVPLLLIDDDTFSMSIEKVVDFSKTDDYYILKVKYQYLDIIYKYIYVETLDNILVLHNLEIEMIGS